MNGPNKLEYLSLVNLSSLVKCNSLAYRPLLLVMKRKKAYEIDTCAQCYKTFYACSSLIFVIS